MYAERVIHADLESVAAAQPYTILQLEADLTGSLDVSVNGTQITVRLKGKADRIDRTAKGKVRVIDYKTGSAKNKKFEISSRSEFGQSDSDYAFQLLLYQLMYAQMNEGADSLPSIYFLRLKEVEKQLSVMDEKMVLTGGDLVNYTNELLSELLEELLNQEIPFEQTTREKNCEYCEFISLCQRD
ncbi:MAG: PD-(D/E)XK nuclease family protein [Bacteroidetes bacterium]|nr:MAG: PD-(D/E)XK nuclease family protein [Bacteroidota bacterium]